MIPAEIVAKFWLTVDVQDDSVCWLWTGTLNKYGYAQFRFRFDAEEFYPYAHRVAYELMVGPIPEGLEIDHLCRNASCVNPLHLEPVTHAENMRRTEVVDICRAGHSRAEFSYRRTRGDFECRECRRLGKRKRRILKRAATP